MGTGQHGAGSDREFNGTEVEMDFVDGQGPARTGTDTIGPGAWVKRKVFCCGVTVGGKRFVDTELYGRDGILVWVQVESAEKVSVYDESREFICRARKELRMWSQEARCLKVERSFVLG